MLASNYSLSDIELQITEYIYSQNTEDFSDVLEKDNRFEVYYHLSPIRSGLIGWYNFETGKSILELNAELGCFTGFLCDAGLDVTSFTSTQEKANAIAYRYSERTNLNIRTGFPDVNEFEGVFDYVLLDLTVGFCYTDDLQICSLFSEICKFMNSNGKIIVIADNRYSMNNLSGKTNVRHTPPFEDIDGNEKHSFDKAQLESILKKSGILYYKFYYPFADAFLPKIIFSDDCLPKSNLFERAKAYFPSLSTVLFDQNNMVLDAVKNNAFHFVANSFLIEISMNDKLSSESYITLTTFRGKEKAFATAIHSDGKVTKKWLYKEGKIHAIQLYEDNQYMLSRKIPVVPMYKGKSFLKMNFIEGETVQEHLRSLSEKRNKQEIICIFDKLWEYILQSSEESNINELNKEFSQKSTTSGWGKILKKAFIEMIPLNSFWNNGNILFFDQEFVKENYPAKYVIFRAIKNTWFFIPDIESICSKEEIYERYGLNNDILSVCETADQSFLIQINQIVKYRNLEQWNYSNPMVLRKNRLNLSLQNNGSKKYRIGYVPGVFDMFHEGHLNLLKRSKEMCDYLIAGVLTDDLVEFYKNKRPVINLESRKHILESIRYVDEVVVVDAHNTDKIEAWKLYHYDCHFSGDDHDGEWDEIKRQLNALGSDLYFFKYTEGVSSTQLRKQIQN